MKSLFLCFLFPFFLTSNTADTVNASDTFEISTVSSDTKYWTVAHICGTRMQWIRTYPDSKSCYKAAKAKGRCYSCQRTSKRF